MIPLFFPNDNTKSYLDVKNPAIESVFGKMLQQINLNTIDANNSLGVKTLFLELKNNQL